MASPERRVGSAVARVPSVKTLHLASAVVEGMAMVEVLVVIGVLAVVVPVVVFVSMKLGTMARLLGREAYRRRRRERKDIHKYNGEE